MQVTFCNGTIWAIEIKRGLSSALSPGFDSALEDLNPEKPFVVDGGDVRYRLKPEVEAIPLLGLQHELLGA